MEIRIMRMGDYEEVHALWRSCPGMGLNDVDDSREGIARYLARNPDTCFVAVEDECIVGAILCGHDGRRGHISHTAVLPARQGRGIGRALAEAAVEGLRRQGISKVNLVVFRDNEAGNAFWERMGFAARRDLNYRDLALTDMVRMDTPLPG